MRTPDTETIERELATEIARIHRESYGRGSAESRAHLDGEDLVVVLDGIDLLPNEEFMILRGQADTVARTRTAFQEAARTVFNAGVERISGRRVVGFSSATNLEERYSVEYFKLAPSEHPAKGTSSNGGPSEADPSPTRFHEVELEEAWLDGDPTARWRSGAGHGPGDGAGSSGGSLLEVDPGLRVPRHTDSAEETIVVIAGAARVVVSGEAIELGPGDSTFVPADEPHEVRSIGAGVLRFVAVYAGPDVVTTYEEAVQPAGERERRPFG
jgi:quercetin dioxygenase-like cupin family protein/uncharacterized protein YbcI